MKVLGIVLVVLGVLGLAYGGISWTKRDKVIDIGPVQVTHDETERLPLPPIVGGICLAAGVVLLMSSSRGARPI